jgi:hypothetical protein
MLFRNVDLRIKKKAIKTFRVISRKWDLKE